jgi:regulator of protease activity HflC (stomatin/prohibitin superfamily)
VPKDIWTADTYVSACLWGQVVGLQQESEAADAEAEAEAEAEVAAEAEEDVNISFFLFLFASHEPVQACVAQRRTTCSKQVAQASAAAPRALLND